MAKEMIPQYPKRRKTAHYKAAVCVGLFLCIFCVQGFRSFYEDGNDVRMPVLRKPRSSFVRKLLEVTTLPPEDECDDEAECRDVHKMGENATNQDRCDFVMRTCDCGNDEGILEYNQWVFCPMKSLRGLAMTILAIWLIFVFVALAVTADDYFCPSLVVISKVLHLSPNVAGVTFLAFGNGAPDLFSAIAALEGGGDPALGLGGLLGAGVFVTTIVVGTISVIKPFKAMERPFLRDATFYLLGIYWTFFVLWKGRIYLGEAIGFLCFWLFYVIVVIVSGSIYKKQKKSRDAEIAKLKPDGLDDRSALQSDKDYTAAPSAGMKKSETQLSIDGALMTGQVNEGFQPDKQAEFNGVENIHRTSSLKLKNNRSSVEGLTFKSIDLSVISEDDSAKFQVGASPPTTPSTEMTDVDMSFNSAMNNNVGDEKKEEEEDEGPVNYWREFGMSVIPINVEEWPEMKWYSRAYEVFKCPFVFFINITCPVVDYEADRNGWNKYLHCLQFLVAPVLCSILIQHGFSQIGGVFPVWALMLILGFAAAVAIFFTTKCEEAPKGHDAFGFISFFIALIWIYVIANELVSLLETFGVVLNISEAILGLTLLAWGNSIGDWISNSLMARQGFARMGFSACFGGPFFNLSLGFGIPMVISMVRDSTNQLPIVMSGVQLILTTTIMFSVLSSMIFLNVAKFKVNKIYGIYLFILYGAFLTIALLCETGVILQGWKPT